jgi:hypothetical protein
MVNKRGQIKIQQMVFMILGLTVFFVIAGLFVLSLFLSGLKSSQAATSEQQATLLVENLANSPEFACGSAFGTQRTDCIDMDKALALKDHAGQYASFWGVQEIEILRLYPPENFSIECTNETYPNCGRLSILKTGNTGTDDSAYVSLCRKEKYGNSFYDKCEMGELAVRISNG